MEGGPPAAAGASAMLQSQMAKDGGKGGVINTIEPIKGLDTNTVEQLFGGNLQAAAQGLAGFFGMTQANAAELLNLKELSATGLPGVVGEMQEKLQDLEGKGYVKIFQMGEDSIMIVDRNGDALIISSNEGGGILSANFQNDLHSQCREIGNGLIGYGLNASAFQDCDPSKLHSPEAVLKMKQHGQGAALGG